MRRSFGNAFREKALELIAPGPFRCYGCGFEAVIGPDGLCPDCRAKILFCPAPTVLQPLDGLAVGVQYTDPIRHAVIGLKSDARFFEAPFLAQYMTVPDGWQVDLLVPVPLHPIRSLLRGFNQSELLAQLLSARTGIPYSNKLLYKSRFTAQQKQLTPEARRKNVRNSFRADPLCKGLRLVLIDDLFTTGATLYECAKTLKRAGASAVYGCVAASPRR